MTPTTPIRTCVSLLLFKSLFSDFYPSDPTSAIPEEDVFDTGVIDNYRGVDTLAVDKEARSLLFKYMGDLYRDASEDIGESSGAGSEQSEWFTAHSSGTL